MKEQFPADTYKYYATFSRLAFKLYQEGQAELITTLITSGVDLSGTIYTIEALLSNKPEYFSFQTNVWVCIANNAITHYKIIGYFVRQHSNKAVNGKRFTRQSHS